MVKKCVRLPLTPTDSRKSGGKLREKRRLLSDWLPRRYFEGPADGGVVGIGVGPGGIGGKLNLAALGVYLCHFLLQLAHEFPLGSHGFALRLVGRPPGGQRGLGGGELFRFESRQGVGGGQPDDVVLILLQSLAV